MPNVSRPPGEKIDPDKFEITEQDDGTYLIQNINDPDEYYIWKGDGDNLPIHVQLALIEQIRAFEGEQKAEEDTTDKKDTADDKDTKAETAPAPREHHTPEWAQRTSSRAPAWVQETQARVGNPYYSGDMMQDMYGMNQWSPYHYDPAAEAYRQEITGAYGQQQDPYARRPTMDDVRPDQWAQVESAMGAIERGADAFDRGLTSMGRLESHSPSGSSASSAARSGVGRAASTIRSGVGRAASTIENRASSPAGSTGPSSSAGATSSGTASTRARSVAEQRARDARAAANRARRRAAQPTGGPTAGPSWSMR